jgi:hypothetical protein
MFRFNLERLYSSQLVTVEVVSFMLYTTLAVSLIALILACPII